MDFSFNIYNKHATDGLTMAIDKLLASPTLLKKDGYDTSLPPIVVCVGSDLAIGDSLGPIVGSMLAYKTQGLGVFLYGTLASPVTAKEIKYARQFLKETHKRRLVIAIDAAVGENGDIGLIKCHDRPLSPGSGAGKKLGTVGDISLLGVVAEKSISNYNLLNSTRLNLVYSMAEIISSSLSCVLWEKYAPVRKRGAR
ncbi:MAG: spore protease YyaC [Clostridia bacterium]|nr:spore protease YyaC [Clostridia bacterium]